MNVRHFLAAAAILTAAAFPYSSSAADRKAVDSRVDLRVPMDIPLVLSANFGELRSNHFHSGLDFKTQGRTGIAVYAAADGYVSRVLVSPWSFGRAVYITHPELGLVTVYGHLKSFSTRIDRPVRARQYADELFRVDMEFAPGELPVKRGELIGRSGNSGSSGGPHLHMDVRDLSTGYALDPLKFYRRHIRDTRPPEVRALALYPRDGVVDGASKTVYHSGPRLSDTFTAWGRVVPGIKAYDLMDGTSNIYGIRRLTLVVDGDTVYRRVIDSCDFNRTRAVNTLVEYADVVNDNSWNMITELPDSRPLADMIEASGDGSLYIDQERDYRCVFILEDYHGNRSRAPFIIRGQRQTIPPSTLNGRLLAYNRAYTLAEGGASLTIPANTLYSDAIITIEPGATPDEAYSRVYTVGNEEIPLAGNVRLSLRIDRDTLPSKERYCLVRYRGLKPIAVSATYEDGQMTAAVNRFGIYAVQADSVAPKITPQRPDKWSSTGMLTYKISDNLSGIETYRLEIDGNWACAELDGKTGTVTFKMDPTRWQKGRKHTAVMTVSDACGNKTTDTHTFRW